MNVLVKDIPIMTSLQDWHYLSAVIITGDEHGNYVSNADEKKINNPCGHMGLESVSCDICGYPDPRKVITRLTKERNNYKIYHLAADKDADEQRTENADLIARLKKLEAFWEQAREVEKMNFELEWKLKHNDEPETDKALEAFYNPANDNITCAEFLKRYL